MPRAVTLGNGNILIGLDDRAQVRDLYFPCVGLENHISGHHLHRIGVWVEGDFRWFTDPSWEINANCDMETGSCQITALNKELQVELFLLDVVYNEKNIFVRQISIKNLRKKKATIKVYFGQQFHISGLKRGDTGYYDPRSRAIIHYKGPRAFLINARHKDIGFDDYSIGLFEIESKEGSHLDAQDGVLSKNPIEHGSVDSIIGLTFELGGGVKEIFYYWMTIGTSIEEVRELNTYVLKKTPGHLIKTTEDFWRAWVNRRDFSFHGLDETIISLFKKSLLIIRTHADSKGAIIASGDSDMLQYGRDTYSYMWPRDGAFSALAFVRSGSFNASQRFFRFCNNIITPEGYFMHKYRPDGSLGSSWHPWIRDGKAELPIQEDETALVLFALWEHYTITKDLEFVEEIYNTLIESAANFLVHYTHKDLGLPYPSYDLWEEKYGISTFTCSSVYGALIAAAQFAELLGKDESEKRYRDAAEGVKAATLKYLYDKDMKMFVKLVSVSERDMKMKFDTTIDISSFYGIFRFGLLDVNDKRMKEAAETIEKKLYLHKGITGVPRYVGDEYYKAKGAETSNPWFVTTLWLTQYYIRIAKTEKELDRVKECFAWVNKYALPSGVLSEQLHPYTGEQISAAPLTWSHAAFVLTVIDYLEKLEELGVCRACNPIH